MLRIDISTPTHPQAVLLLDEADEVLLGGFKWTPDGKPPRIYATRRVSGVPKIYLHRAIAQPPIGFVVDHIDRNGLNNTRANLRVVRQRDNCWNRGADLKAVSRYKGVYRKRRRWAAEIGSTWIGTFATERSAALAYDAAALALGRDHLGLNIPEEALLQGKQNG